MLTHTNTCKRNQNLISSLSKLTKLSTLSVPKKFNQLSFPKQYFLSACHGRRSIFHPSETLFTSLWRDTLTSTRTRLGLSRPVLQNVVLAQRWLLHHQFGVVSSPVCLGNHHFKEFLCRHPLDSRFSLLGYLLLTLHRGSHW